MIDELLVRAKVIASTVGDVSKTILVNLRGIAASETDEQAEQALGVQLFGALGLVARPRDADADGAAEGIAARAGDSLWPFALIDRRLSKARGAIAKGVISLVGYNRGHVTIEDAEARGREEPGSKITIETPAGTPLRIEIDSGTLKITTLGEARFAADATKAASAVVVALGPPMFTKLNVMSTKLDAALSALGIPTTGIEFSADTDAAETLKAAPP
jgi:hypothetical protein